MMINGLKSFILFVRKILRYCKYRFVSCISFSILFLCGFLFLVAVFANISRRVPIISKLGERISFPQKHELSGVIKIYDVEEPLTIPIDIYIGGFSEHIYTNDEFNLEFLSNASENIPLIVRYKYNESEYNRIEYITFDSDYSMKQIFSFNAGE